MSYQLSVIDAYNPAAISLKEVVLVVALSGSATNQAGRGTTDSVSDSRESRDCAIGLAAESVLRAPANRDAAYFSDSRRVLFVSASVFL